MAHGPGTGLAAPCASAATGPHSSRTARTDTGSRIVEELLVQIDEDALLFRALCVAIAT